MAFLVGLYWCGVGLWFAVSVIWLAALTMIARTDKTYANGIRAWVALNALSIAMFIMLHHLYILPLVTR